MTLKDARDRRDEARRQIANGKDSAKERAVARAAAIEAETNTFSAIGRDFLAYRAADSGSPKTQVKSEWLLSLLEPTLGKKPISEIKATDILATLNEIQLSGRRETAHRLRSFIGRVFRFAILNGKALHDPSTALKGQLHRREVKHHPTILDREEFGTLLKAIDGYTGRPSTVAALRITPHLFQRPGEIRHMRKVDIDLEKRIWSIPAELMKMRRPHRVPLSSPAISIIRTMLARNYRTNYVFPAHHRPKLPISENCINQALRRMGYGGVMTAHGFRSTASTLLNESGLWNFDAIERALAHRDTDSVRSAYNRGEYWEERVRMMDWWSEKIENLRGPQS